jgi:hypothetical protein
LVEALKGHQALVITISVMAPRDTVIKASHAANKAGMRYMFPNWFGNDPANQVLQALVQPPPPPSVASCV